jgi:transcription antitermination factor NusG
MGHVVNPAPWNMSALARPYSQSGGIPIESGPLPAVPGAAWYVVHTKTRAEEKAIGFLSQRDIVTFLPRLLVRRRHGSRQWQAVEPLFPGYLFAYFIPDSPVIDRVRWSPGVKKILGFEEAFIPVPEDVVQLLRERGGASGVIVPDTRLHPGTRVRFQGGPFAYLEGIIERPASRADRVRVLLDLLNVHVSIEVDIHELERA